MNIIRNIAQLQLGDSNQTCSVIIIQIASTVVCTIDSMIEQLKYQGNEYFYVTMFHSIYIPLFSSSYVI